jgi:hypothetical protein
MHFYQESPPRFVGEGGGGLENFGSSPTGGDEYFLDILSRAGSPITPIRRCVRRTHPTGTVKLFIASALDFFRNLFERSYIFKAGLGRVPSGFMRKNRRRAVSMEKGVRICSDLKRTFPRVLNLTHKPISATLTHDQSDLFVDIFLQLLGIQMLDLFKQTLQLLINSFRWF